MSGLELKEKKEKLVKEFEHDCHVKLEEELTPEGLNYLWDKDTSLADVKQMLMAVAVNALLGVVSEGVLAFLFEDEEPEVDKEELCNFKHGTPYRIVRKKDDHLFEMEFETEKAARGFIEDAVRHSPYTINDFSILKVL